ncbi:MAG: hypothetical protein UV38_C0002G0243 [candidate division TM6 bacterium GW2011_GWE2_42_60]|nr:MAG: hypothetical protein UV38_C0002G0243 [candidate division TM6 bacterium GW2011_GWE2_42_60]
MRKKLLWSYLFLGGLLCCNLESMQNPTQNYSVQQVWLNCWNAINLNATFLPIPQNMLPQDINLLLSATDQFTQNTLLHQAVYKNIIAFTQELLTRGSNVNQQNVYGETPLHLAAGIGNPAIARLLLQYGASLDSKAMDGRTALDYALAEGKGDAAQLLILWGAKITPSIQKNDENKVFMNQNINLRNNFLAWARGKKSEFYFTDQNGKSAQVNGFQYLDMLADKIKALLKKDQDYREQKTLVPQDLTNQIQTAYSELNCFVDCHDDNRGTLLHVAVANGQINVLRQLLDCPYIENELWFNERDVNGDTALIKAVEKGNRDMVGFLTMSGADQSIKNNKGYSALSLARGMKKNDLVSILMPSETFEYVVLPPKTVSKSALPSQKSSLAPKARQGALLGLETILETFKKQGVDITDTEETFSDKDIDNLLLQLNPNYYMFDRGQLPIYTYLHGAVLNGNSNAAGKLLNKNWQLLYMPDNQNSGKLPIHYAAMLDRPDFAEYFLTAEDKLFEQKFVTSHVLKMQQDLFGRTPLSYAAMTGDHALCKMLFSPEANFAADKKGVIPLFYAAQAGNWELVKWFLDQNPLSTSRVDNFGKSVLSYALKSGNNDLISNIISYAKTIQKGQMSFWSIPLFDKAGNSVLKDAIVTEMPIDKENNRGAIVEILCKEYPDLINKIDNFGETPLYYALSKTKDLKLATLLLQYGADSSIKNAKGETVRGRAVHGSELEKLLEKAEKDQQQLFIDFARVLAEFVK